MKKIMALVLAALMLLGCCSFAAAEEVPAEYPEIIEGLDFGGATVYINDWYPANALKNPPKNSRLSMTTGIGWKKPTT